MAREIVVRETGGRYTQRIEAGKHTLLADEPEPIGGDAGPDPYDLLLGAIGACTTMTVRMYAEHKGWPLESVSVRLTYNRLHAKDCDDCEDKSGRVHRIESIVTFDGALSDEQRDRLLEIAERCPVHRTLVEQKQMITRLA